jgi:PLP dependent protein
MENNAIKRNVESLLQEMPPGVELVAAAKTRTAEEVRQAVEAGVRVIGENYVQEAADLASELPAGIKMHFIGHLQKNKVKKAVEVFDLIETVDSIGLAKEIDKRSRAISKLMPVFIEVNSAGESQKHGVLPDEVEGLIRQASILEGIKIMGLMTMGPFVLDPEKIRPYFSLTKELFDNLAAKKIPSVEMSRLSMGMSDSYRVAIEEGANLVRVGTGIFGSRKN